MSQRNSGYQRKPRDEYFTPPWVIECLLPHLPPRLHIWEAAAGSGKMVRVLSDHGHIVEATDIVNGIDFLTCEKLFDVDAIVTNPPFNLATRFIERALEIADIVAIVVRIDFDSAKTRQHLFAKCPHFSKKIVLLKRVVWIEGSTGSPSFNHCWMLWDRSHRGPPTIAYAPIERRES